MADKDIEEKQNFLREKILDKGYDTNDFTIFLKAKKGEDGEDVSNWTMPELEQVVKEFISLVGEPKKKQETQTVENKPKNIQNNQSSKRTSSSSNLNTETSDPSKDEEYGIVTPDFVECQPIELTDFGKYENIEIVISSLQKVDKGIFTKSFYSFSITTNPFNFHVDRRYSDFDWLRERLSVMFHTSILPRIPKKGEGDQKMERRKRDLEKFLNYLLKDPLIRNSQILLDFLSINNDDDFHKAKKIYDKIKLPTDFKDFKTINGKARVNVNKNKEQYLEYIRDNAAFNETALTKLDLNFKALKLDMFTLINRINSFSPLFDKLIKISSKYFDEDTIIESYKQIKHLFESWATTLKTQNKFFFIDVKEYFKLLGGNYHHTRELVQVVENQKANYYKNSKSLISKKDELFKKQDTANWQLDIGDRNNLVSFYTDKSASVKKICFKETNNMIKLKEKYGFYLNRMISEYERNRHINATENKKKIIEFCKKQQKIMSDYINIMGEIIGIMDGCVIQALKEDEILKNANPDIDINENTDNNNNQQQEKDKNEENKNDNYLDE